MALLDIAALAARYEAVKASIPQHVTLVAVSKTRTVSEIQALYDMGHRDFGENYPQELREKQPFLPVDIRWHFIGHLQTNKVKYIAPFTQLIHGVDSEKLLDEIDKRAASIERIQDVLLQIHIAKEETKHGFTADEVQAVTRSEKQGKWRHVRVRGLMGMATNTEDQEQVKGEFDGLSALFHTLRSGHFDQLSMGMSGDADLAISAGSTMVRIGTAIFGERIHSAGQ